ncbi:MULTISPECIES: cell wall hydrolase [Neobacillus]|jgi:N-acetylmuramoyl-L-alanine amidase|uniref:LysM peptidoglycan-binding domain-containing protein n=2 Tax=Neobacillus TaxID=2675232 RepID=A0A6B3TQA1_9BACI|nr:MULTISPECIES: cell wall hydrolase [Neobacillus]AIM16016.1 peptidoglycan-binding protein [Bacillus sp. X1(2014)]MCD4838965.1 cell wall hydrolase [Neobacillus sedimentimangrovi]NEX79175.1 LysM peptidoglycan-binding domain-containing protein [Neobacillus thermocopriae]
MRKLKKLIIVTGMIVSITAFSNINKAEASTTRTVQKGETYWNIAKGFGVPVDTLMNANNKKPLIAGQTMILPNSPISAADKDLMARLVRAEAVGEPYAGKVAVATVILNRLKHPDFPNTIRGVIYQIDGGHYAFTPVANGQINKAADNDSKRAVNEAIALMGKGNGSLYFYNPKTSSSKWILSRPVTVKIGNHVFAK